MTAMYWVAVALGGAVGALGRAFLLLSCLPLRGFPCIRLQRMLLAPQSLG